MRIAIVSCTAKRKAPPDYVQALAKGMSAMGHRADIIDAWTDDGMRLPGYEYVVVATEPNSFFSGKIPKAISKVLSAGSTLGGKKSAAFIKKTGLFSNRALGNLMKAMEKEGMVINWSDLILSAPYAEAIGKQVK